MFLESLILRTGHAQNHTILLTGQQGEVLFFFSHGSKGYWSLTVLENNERGQMRMHPNINTIAEKHFHHSLVILQLFRHYRPHSFSPLIHVVSPVIVLYVLVSILGFCKGTTICSPNKKPPLSAYLACLQIINEISNIDLWYLTVRGHIW